MTVAPKGSLAFQENLAQYVRSRSGFGRTGFRTTEAHKLLAFRGAGSNC